MGLSRHPAHPRRWAFGVYAQGVGGVTDVGEMHLRKGWYFGVAPVDDETVNLCVVTGPRPEGRTPQEIVRRVIAADRLMAARTREAAFVSDVRVLGPLAVDVDLPGRAGLFLAGDAAGFVDPMTGDGLHLAIQSAMLTAQSVLRAIEHGDVHGEAARLATARDGALARKLRFNRLLRRLVDAPAVLDLAAWTASFAPGFVHRAVSYAGDAG
jgi:flavin-dependent dehydrogenase